MVISEQDIRVELHTGFVSDQKWGIYHATSHKSMRIIEDQDSTMKLSQYYIYI